jgi:ABC-type polysaccharide/polyol phosphate transport system ATPase subunit
VVDAVTCVGVSKTFKLYRERNQSMKTTLLSRSRHRFDEFHALDDVSFSVPEGSTFGIVGANGAGKSTTLKILAQILQPDKGEVQIRGRVAALLELGAGFHAELSGRENIFLNGSVLGMSRKEIANRLDDIVAFSGLESFIDNAVKTYSSGMYARLGFAVAVNVEPDVLLIDEVLAVGDEAFQRRCAERISELRSGGRTVVLVSHGLAQLQSLCDRGVWIDKGKVKAIGSAPDVVNSYLESVSNVSVSSDQSESVAGAVRLVSTRAVVNDSDSIDLSAGSLKLRSGSAVGFEISFEVIESPETMVCGIWIVRHDGILVASTRTGKQLELNHLRNGAHTVMFQVDRLDLLSGSYHLGVAFADDTIQNVHASSPRALNFDVIPQRGADFQEGVSRLHGSWVFKK